CPKLAKTFHSLGSSATRSPCRSSPARPASDPTSSRSLLGNRRLSSSLQKPLHQLRQIGVGDGSSPTASGQNETFGTGPIQESLPLPASNSGHALGLTS